MVSYFEKAFSKIMGSRLKILKLFHGKIIFYGMQIPEVLSRFISVQILLS